MDFRRQFDSEWEFHDHICAIGNVQDDGKRCRRCRASEKNEHSGILAFASQHTLRSYEDGKLGVIVLDSDLSGQNVELTAAKTTKKDLDMNELFGGDEKE